MEEKTGKGIGIRERKGECPSPQVFRRSDAYDPLYHINFGIFLAYMIAPTTLLRI